MNRRNLLLGLIGLPVAAPAASKADWNPPSKTVRVRIITGAGGGGGGVTTASIVNAGSGYASGGRFVIGESR